MNKIIWGLLFLGFMLPSSSFAVLINYDIDIDLSTNQISGDSWRYGINIDPTTTFQDGDSVHVNVNFLGDEELVWSDLGLSFEYASLTIWADPVVQLNIMYDVVFRWHDPLGDNLFDELSGTSSSSGGAIGASSTFSNEINVTDDFFSLVGFTFELNNLRDRASVAGDSGLPATFDRINLNLSGGDFYIQDRAEVSEPPVILLFLLALIIGYVFRTRAKLEPKNLTITWRAAEAAQEL
ncbi:MAG: hypothetical protein OEZ43_19625 [Gammaproteobacteria bacterium]|nr:hypothetical protein [Gammaproteobacteria bacterium]